jgi:hypothetical protein
VVGFGNRFLLSVVLACAAAAAADEKPEQPAAPSRTPELESARPLPEASTEAAEEVRSGASRRNENIAIHRIDTGAIKELMIRLGNSVTIAEPAIDRGSYATEHGRPPGEPIYHRPGPAAKWHGTAFASHQNSVFNARTFFQVGPVQASRQNSYGASGAGPLGERTTLHLDFSQRKIRGMVNGNVLVPLPSERTPRAQDPNLRALIQRYLNAYPDVLPNRLDFDPRALNTNAPQVIDETRGAASGGRRLSERLRLGWQYSASHQFVDAFQLVAGQNPDTDVGSQTAKLSLLGEAAGGAWDTGVTFQRTRSLLVAEPNAVGAYVRFGFQMEELGPSGEIPIDRAQNVFRMGTQYARLQGAHRFTLGFEFHRYQLNGIETRNQHPTISFGNNFGRNAIENLLMGTANLYEVSVGEVSRGFRHNAVQLFAGDTWRPAARLELKVGIRLGLEGAAHEVRGRTPIPYGCDCNNFAPLAALAYSLPDQSVLRASYTISYGQIYPVTYQQARFNPPDVIGYAVANPDLLNPLAGVVPGRTALLLLNPDLAAPYASQYNFSWERALAGRSVLRLGYVGSRTVKIPYAHATNRARPVPGIPLTTATVNERRPDPDHYEITRVFNNGIAYLDAAQAVYELPRARGLLLRAAYTFSKAIDTGADYAHTAANRDALRGRPQSEDDIRGDKKGLSDFDGTHHLLLQYGYELPWVLKGWELAGVTLVKTGTPATLYIGSDAPGFGNVDGSPSERPHILDPSILGRTIDHPDKAPLILRRDRFSYIAPGEMRGNIGRGTFRRHGIRNFNLALQRTFHLPGNSDRTLAIRGEAVNAFNHPQFDEAQRNFGSPAFGKITNTLNDGRIFQFGLRFGW